MNEFNWNYASNTFEVSTRNSAKKMSILAPDHLSKLQAESSLPAIAALIPDTQAAVNDFALSYNHWIATNGLYKGETNRFTNLLAELSSLKIKQWEAQIQVVHLEGTSDFIALLPNGRKPFQSGAYDTRIAEVGAFAERLSSYPALAALQLAVDTYRASLLAARDLQQQKEGLVNQASNTLNTIRKEMANQMYKNLGLLMAHYYLSPLSIERFYDLELIRSHNTPDDIDLPTPTTGTVAGGAFTNVLNANYTETSLITITNTGTVPLVFYLGSHPLADIMPPSLGIVIDPGITSTHNVLEFGAVFTQFLNVKNTTVAIAGSFEVGVN